MLFDLTISLGNLLTIGSFLGGGFYFVITMKNEAAATREMTNYRLAHLENEQSNTRDELKKLVEVVFMQGEFEKRFNRMEDRMDRLSRGEGFELPISRGAYEVPPRA